MRSQDDAWAFLQLWMSFHSVVPYLRRYQGRHWGGSLDPRLSPLRGKEKARAEHTHYDRKGAATLMALVLESPSSSIKVPVDIHGLEGFWVGS